MPNSKTIIGPFSQLLSMRNLPKKGAMKDELLEIIPNGGIVVADGLIQEIGDFKALCIQHATATIERIESDMVALPGLIDAHTHISFGGTRAADFAARNGGVSYLEIAKAGGGIWSTVTQTRAASQEKLAELTQQRLDKLLQNGITTVEAKSGYGLNVEQELKILRAINQAKNLHAVDVVPTCLAAHMVPKDFDGSEEEYLGILLNELVPQIKEEGLCNRFDVFIEDSAFGIESSKTYLNALKSQGFEITVHGDQFTTGGSKVAVEVGALSVDHLEVSGDEEIALLAKSDVVPVALPGASIGLGCSFTPARKLLDAGCSLAIASDWNPGSAPQGNLVAQASILCTFQKLSAVEVLAGITVRAAHALGLKDRGVLKQGMLADMVAFPGTDYREILYQQGELKASAVWKKGERKS